MRPQARDSEREEREPGPLARSGSDSAPGEAVRIEGVELGRPGGEEEEEDLQVQVVHGRRQGQSFAEEWLPLDQEQVL